MLLLLLLVSTAQADITDYMTPDAISHAEQAVYIQSGASSFVDSCKHWGLLQGKSLIRDWNLQTEERAIGGAYYLYRTKEIPLQLGSSRIIFRLNGIGFEYHW
jgi:hypothetical protein